MLLRSLFRNRLIGALLLALLATGSVSAASTDLDVVKIRDNVYMLVGPVSNTAVTFGREGTLVVNTQTAEMAPKILAAISRLTDYPIRYILNTDMHVENVGGNIIVTHAGKFIGDRGERDVASIVAHENVANRLSGALGNDPPTSSEGWPEDVYFRGTMDMRFNGEAVQLMYQPTAHTDGDSVVFLRGADVICTGDIFVPDSYPQIDLVRGGSVQGVIDALNRIIDLAVPDFNEEGGTLIIPGHGRVTDEYDLVIYRDMLTIVVERIKTMIGKGMTLQQVLAARPTLDYDGIYGHSTGNWTTSKFIEAVYQDLSRK